MTIAVGKEDVDIALLVNLRKFIEEECVVGLCSMEHCVMVTHKHFQMVVKGNCSRLLVSNKKIKVCLGWDKSPPMGHVILATSCKMRGCIHYWEWLGIHSWESW